MTTTAPESPTRRRSLFNISDDLLALEDLIAQSDGDISDPAVAEAVEAWFKELASDQGKKIDGYASLIAKWQGEAVAAKAEAEQYQKRAKVRENRVGSFKARLKMFMEATHQTKIETPTGRTVSIQQNGGVAPMTVDQTVDPKRLDPRFQLVTTNINTDAVRQALTAGEALEFASLGQRGTSLRIK